MKMRRLLPLLAFAAVLAAACGKTSQSADEGTGGASASGGENNAGSGGSASSTGGAAALGGSSGSPSSQGGHQNGSSGGSETGESGAAGAGCKQPCSTCNGKLCRGHCQPNGCWCGDTQGGCEEGSFCCTLYNLGCIPLADAAKCQGGPP